MGVQHRHIAHRTPATWAALIALILLAATSLLMARPARPAEPDSTPIPTIGGAPLAETWHAAEPDPFLRYTEAQYARSRAPVAF